MRQDLSTLLRKARGFALLTQTQLAAAIGISRRAVAGYEADENEPPITVVLEWLRVCDRPISDLVELMSRVAEEAEVARNADAAAPTMPDRRAREDRRTPRNRCFSGTAPPRIRDDTLAAA